MKNEFNGRGRAAGRVLLLLYVACAVYFLFFCETYGRTDVSTCYRYNLVLFREIVRFWTYRERLGTAAVLINIVGNAVLFIPYGFALPFLFRRMENGFLTVAACFATSLVVETAQLISRVGCFDVDDLFLNTLGGLAGYLLFLAVRHFRRRKLG